MSSASQSPPSRQSRTLLPDEQSSHPAIVHFLDQDPQVESLVPRLATQSQLAVDLESNGMFAYQPRICLIQLGWEDPDGHVNIAVIDALACRVSTLAPLLASKTIEKIIHDISFDARMLHTAGLFLANVFDTSVAAGYTGRTSTGLASLVAHEFDIQLSKESQNSDWARRPLSSDDIQYIANDVRYLFALYRRLLRDINHLDIADELATETAYKLGQVDRSKADTRLPHERISGSVGLSERQAAVLREIAAWRQAMALRDDVPPQRMIGDPILLNLATATIPSANDLQRFGGQIRRLHESDRRDLWDCIQQGLKGALVASPRPVPTKAPSRAQRTREAHLQAWRKQESRRRNLAEQAVLPTHCIRQLARISEPTLADVLAVEGLGAARSARYATQLLALLEQLHEP